jgi:hypothetical protein
LQSSEWAVSSEHEKRYREGDIRKGVEEQESGREWERVTERIENSKRFYMNVSGSKPWQV